jgi:serine/threonine-protein kinase
MRPGDLLEQRYRLVRVLGRGRSGSVWCARNELIDRAVAVKVLHRSLASDPERLQRFFQEARACGRVRHPAVVEVFDLGQGDDGILFLVMELLDGETLASLLGRRGRLRADEALAIVIPLAQGLAAAHAHGILHRDLKPANVYLHRTPTGGLQPKILDFGISKIVGNDLTAAGVVLGTPSYMSPEQVRGEELDARTDVWSLGVILYEALTGKLPFPAREYRPLVDEILGSTPPSIAAIAPDTPPDVLQIVAEALEKSRDRRLDSAGTFAHRLTAILRRLGREDLLRAPEDEFAEGAPTLTNDRKVLDAAQKASEAQADPVPTTPIAWPLVARRSGGGDRPAAESGDPPKPSPMTAAIAAQTAGAKRLEIAAGPRPAAGAPAKREVDPSSEMTVGDPSTAPTPHGPKPEPSKPGTTRAWEIAAAQAASGRAEVILGASSVGPSPVIRTTDEWETTFAEGGPPRMEKGPLPNLAPSPPTVSEPPPAARASNGRPRRDIKADAVRSGPHDAVVAQPARIDPIPGFNARIPTPTPWMPPPSSQAAPEIAPKAASKNGVGRPTLRPPNDGFAAPATASVAPTVDTKVEAAEEAKEAAKRSEAAEIPAAKAANGRATARESKVSARESKVSARESQVPARESAIARPSQPRAPAPTEEALARKPSNAPSSTSPVVAATADRAALVAPELLALGDHVDPSRGAALGAPPHDAAAVEIPAATEIEGTHRVRRPGSLVPSMVAAVSVLFFVGAALGSFAARKRPRDHHVARFATNLALLATWHDHTERMAVAPPVEPPPEPPPEPAVSAEPEPVAPDPPAVASVAPSASAKTKTPPKTTKVPIRTPPKATAKTPPPPPVSSAPKKSGREWWQKKF